MLRSERLFTIYPKNGNFKCNVNGKINFVSLKENFLEGKGISQVVEKKISKRNFRVETVRFIYWFLIVPGLLNWMVFDPFFREKVVEMKNAHPRWKFHSVNDASHLLQLSTDVVPISSFAPTVRCFPFCQTERSETSWNSWKIMVPHFPITPGQPRAEWPLPISIS